MRGSHVSILHDLIPSVVLHPLIPIPSLSLSPHLPVPPSSPSSTWFLNESEWYLSLEDAYEFNPSNKFYVSTAQCSAVR